MSARLRSVAGALVLTLWVARALVFPLSTARAQAAEPDAGSSCQETWSKERERPLLATRLPDRGTAGHLTWLVIEVDHGVGEQVLPGGVELSADAPEVRLLAAAEFVLPHPASPVKASMERKDSGARAKTTIRLPLIPLPKAAGRHVLELPPLPIAVARASGEVQTLCTTGARITVEDPLAGVPAAEPSHDPPPRPQRELWTAARDLAIALCIAIPAALLLALLFLRFKDAFKKAPPPVPPRPAWEVALSRLQALEQEGLLDRHEYETFLDGVVDTLREYLGSRYGFDGLECTTREILRQLEQRAPDFSSMLDVRGLLQRTDLVKFARRLPTVDECREAIDQVRRIVRTTTPGPSLDPRSAGPAEARS
jgi:hypothetical protein